MTYIMFLKLAGVGSFYGNAGDRGRKLLQLGKVSDDERLGGAGHKLFPLEAAHDARSRFDCHADHIG